jgi:alanine racemase
VIGCIRVSLDALRDNARALRDLVAPARASFVVKSNGYGHGMTEVARAVEPFTDRLCVYSIDEAIELHDAGIAAPIFIMGPIESADLEEAVARKFEIALWDTGAYLRALCEAARARHERPAVHVKVNSGVARLGLEPADAEDALEDYARLPEIEIAGIFSHLAAAEELDSPFTMEQLDKFRRVTQAADPMLQTRGVHPVRHIAASAAAMLWPQTRLDMVRIGVALYGLWPSPQTRVAMNGAKFELEPVLSFETRLVAMRTVEAGTPIGYGCSYHAPKRTRIGVVPLGYADGIPRLLSNRGEFIVGGARCPVVGRVCMNMTLVDLAPAPGAKPGDTVTLIGRQGDASVSADDWAQWAETINYEIVARLPAELRRDYSSLSG